MDSDHLRLLMLEDTPTDAELILYELRGSSRQFDACRVQNREEFVRALETFKPDIILADYQLPAFDGLAALAIVEQDYPEIPFIFVTGAMGEEIAIETLVRGATDYVLKDRLSKLVPAVERAIAETEARSLQREAETELRERLEELERLNRLMVGRELRMVELKEENEKLKAELAQRQQIPK